MSSASNSKHPYAIKGLIIAVAIASSPQAYSRVLLPGESAVVTNPPSPEAWAVSDGGTLTINNAEALTITSANANVDFNGGKSQRISMSNSVLSISGAAIESTTGRGAIQLIDSSATIDNNTTITSSNSFGLLLGRNQNTPASSSATVKGGSTITGGPGGANAVGFAVLNVENSTIRGTGATSYGVQLGGSTLSATGSLLSGEQDGLQIVTDLTGVNNSTVTLNDTRVTGGTGSAIVLGSSGAAGTAATINVLGNSQLVGGNGNLLQATNRSTANLIVDASHLSGNVVAETGSSISLLMQNGAALEGDLQNVTQVSLDSGSTLNGNVLSVASTASKVSLNNNAVLNGNIENVASLSLNNGSQITGNVLADINGRVELDNRSAINGNVENVSSLVLNNGSNFTGDVITASKGSVLLDNASVLTGQINNSASLNINNAAQWVMTGDNTVQSLALDNGVVRMGTNEQFQQLNVGDLSGRGAFVMGTDLGNGNTDFLNVTGNATGQHQLQIAATGTTPVTAEAVKVGNIAAGDASFSLGGRETVDAGAFVYRLKQDGQGLYLNPDRETVSTSTNTALALVGSARSVSNAEMNLLNSQIGDRGLSIRPDASMRAASESDTTKLSNSVWVRTYGNQYNVKNAYGDGYTQNQTGITGGADTTVNIGGQDAVLGAFVGTSRTDMDLKYGSKATVDSLSLGVYGSTFDPVSGIFINALLKINQFDNKARVTMSDGTRSKGDYKALGASGAVTVGKHFRFGGDWFLEPQIGLSTGVTQSDSYRLDNGLEVDADTMRSVQGNIGIRGGRLLTLEGGALLEPSVSLGANREFVKTNEVKINDDSFNDDRASNTLEYRAGLKWTPAQRNWQVAGEVGGGTGNTVSQDWSASLRVSHFF
ncbi:MAG TPA: autotransporter outer membrane beta-barrel domain-containing protein [Pseudomonas sp.]|uniref:autotransporter outer membrane beta-barrel domain-containing protein n=1 Tax=Pseudomonas sp. TaxID=306 RepID=UPI002C8586A7|nr:autotransporter outer membrane beta-barrel domain-containing protein [Pseudomonas sp.]HWH88893.1 autotransporter outer membrane beta-barrel domain-containing protein [Pseudomonas sp.]